ALGWQREANHAAVGLCDHELAERRVDAGIGDVDQTVPLGPGDKALDRAVEVATRRRLLEHSLELLLGQWIHVSSPLSFWMPSWTLRRAAASEQSSAWPMPA